MHEKAKGSYVIGIDLGTTNCSLAYSRITAEDAAIELLEIPQWDGEGRLFRDVKLPSFTWILPKSLQKSGSRRLPWQAADTPTKWVVGREAKAESLKDQGRVIHSAKSWLSVGAGSTRQSAFLPWGSVAASADEKLSPVAVQSAYLEHLKAAWDASQTEALADQSIVITVPASFDELAQRLTLEAAQRAGFPEGVRLLEEPLAAFYDYWQRDSLQEQRGLLLICDVGGGTSDFSLLRVQGSAGEPAIERIKVSEHILLGGDNIDLHLAHQLAQRMGPQELPRSSWSLLLAQVRQLKETVLSVDAAPDEEFFISVPLSSQLLGASATASITRQELLASIMQGFFPAVSNEARAEEKASAGLRSWGLPYAEDTAITRHLAAFLDGEAVDAVLFAGGTLLPAALQQHLHKVLQGWQPQRPLQHLRLPDSDLAIARGAARFAALRERASAVVHSPYPYSLYVALQNRKGEEQLTCLIPRGWPREKAAVLELPGLKLRLGSEVVFRLYADLGRHEATIGADVPHDARLRALPLVSTMLDKGASEIPISLQALVRETGLLELRCLAADGSGRRWLLDFAIEGGSETAAQTAASAADGCLPPRLFEAENGVRQAFGKQGTTSGIASLPKQLEEILGPRSEWNMPTLRALWPALEDGMFRRQKDADAEAVWLYLSGFCLRPGFGASRDSERISSLWRIYDQGYSKGAGEKKLEEQWFLLWRRVAAGLNRAQQNRMMDRILPAIRKIGEAGPEMIRLAASLERADASKRIQLGRSLLQQIVSGNKDQLDARIWALARLASRYPLYAGPEALLPIALVEEWAESLKALPLRSKAYQKLSLFYAWAGRRRGDVFMDLDETWRQHFIERLREAGGSADELEAIASPLGRDQRFLQAMFGESLPLGLLLR